MSAPKSVPPCPICKSEHLITENGQSDRSSASTVKRAGKSMGKEAKQSAQIDGTRKRYQPATRCPLPEHVFKFKALIVDHNIISQKLMQKTLEKLGLSSDQAQAPEDGLSMYLDDPMKYTVVCINPMFHRGVRGLDLMSLIRKFECLNSIPPCFLVCTDGSRAVSMGRTITREMVIDCGVDLVLPGYCFMIPLYDALAGIQQRPVWCNKPDLLRKVDVQEIASLPTRSPTSGV
ncbi:hypothetical protein SVAN01_03837 [Stagonosporopsis vannaccii]|nr:hypothetical protein SVAN01_03837 [Stagonosporopsis vannaccii]